MKNLLFVVIGLTLLILGGNWLLKSAVGLSIRLAIPKIVIGMTVVSMATSAPELIVSINAALAEDFEFALSNVIGSNIANLGLVLGIIVLLGKIDVQRSFYIIDWPVMMTSSLLFVGFIYFDRLLQQYEGGVMVILLFIFLVYLLRFQKTAIVDDIPEDDKLLPLHKIILFLGIGGIGLWSGSEILLYGAKGMSYQLGIEKGVVGLLVLSVGTSIPELAASIIAVLKKEKAISVGNLIGSNIFNLLAVLGFTSLIRPIPVLEERVITSDIYWMLGISFIILPLVFFPKGQRLWWHDGVILLLTYILFFFFTVNNL